MHNIINEYHINKSTMALLSATNTYYSTIVIEPHRQILVRKTPIQLIKTGCLDGGSTYDGRRKAVAHLTGCMQKPPIPINPGNHLFAFPTHSPSAFECNWIFYNHIKSIKPSVNNNDISVQSILHFKNEQTLLMRESHYILQKQMQRTAICILQFSNQAHEVLRYQEV